MWVNIVAGCGDTVATVTVQCDYIDDAARYERILPKGSWDKDREEVFM